MNDKSLYCANCALFENEDIYGDGWCAFHQEPRCCGDGACADIIKRPQGIKQKKMENEFEGTPGPWGIDTRRVIKDRVVSSNGLTVACTDGNSSEEDEANARLIAAAPELLEALQKTNDLLKDLDNTHTGNDRYRDFAIQYADNIKIINKALEG